MSVVLKLVAWCLAAAVTYATLGPPGHRPHAASLGQGGEHAVAFVLVGLAFGLAYARTRLLTAAMVIAFTGAIEILQFWAPGRHARLMDFVVDAAAACAGLAAAAILNLIVGRRGRAPDSQTS